MKLIESKTLVSAQTAIEFTSIPQTFTDLVAVCSLRSNRSAANSENVGIRFNGSTSGYSDRNLYGSGSGTLSLSQSGSYFNFLLYSSTTAGTSNTFGNAMVYIPNYTGSTNKSVGTDAVTESNSTASVQNIGAGLWSNTEAINSIRFFVGFAEFATELQAGSTISLYGVLKGSDGIVTTSP